MKSPTAKEVRLAAMSVLGARSAGIETLASKAAPNVLMAAEKTLLSLLHKAETNEPSAPSMSAEYKILGLLRW